METKEYRLPREFAEKWVKALRSGDYKQDTGYLIQGENDDKSYCCLGVACKIQGINEKNFKKKIDWFWLNNEVLKTGQLRMIPKEIQGSDNQNELVYELSSMNDNKINFNNIADWIEENVEFY